MQSPGDIASNLNFGKDSGTEKDWKEAAQIACAEEFILKKQNRCVLKYSKSRFHVWFFISDSLLSQLYLCNFTVKCISYHSFFPFCRDFIWQRLRQMSCIYWLPDFITPAALNRDNGTIITGISVSFGLIAISYGKDYGRCHASD